MSYYSAIDEQNPNLSGSSHGNENLFRESFAVRNLNKYSTFLNDRFEAKMWMHAIFMSMLLRLYLPG